MTARGHRRMTALLAVVMCGLAGVVGAGASLAGAASTRASDTIAGTGASVVSGGVGLSIPRPTGSSSVGVRSMFVLDPARTEPSTGGPRAIPVRVWYPARQRRGSSAPYFSPSVQAFIEAGLREQLGVPVPDGLFTVDTHATLDAPARPHLRGVLVFTGAFGLPVAFATGLITELASRGYAVVSFDHPHETFVVEQPDGSLIAGDLADDAGPGIDCSSPSDCPVFEARLGDIAVVLGALEDLVPQARRRTPIGIFGHSNGGAAAAVAIRRHPQLRAGVNLDGYIPPELITVGLNRPFGLMLGLDQQPEELRDIEVFLSNMSAPYAVRSPAIHHYGFSDFVVFNPQAQRTDPVLGASLEAVFVTGTLDNLRAGQLALAQQRRFLVGFFDRYLKTTRGSGAGRSRPEQ